ncbi:MAG: glycoside hydrolase family 30 protein [Verrucomicrobiota bacterium]
MTESTLEPTQHHITATHLDQASLFRTSKNSEERLKPLGSPEAWLEYDKKRPLILVDPKKQFQEIVGFGGAFTEAASTNFYKLSPENREKILTAYFDPNEGYGYTIGCTHINSCDFSLRNFAYVETPGDFDLKTFSISRDLETRIPFIKESLKKRGAPIRLLASPWSPPAWMKTTGKMNQGGKLKPECRQAWANYYCRFIQEYEKQDISIWGVTVQNEAGAVTPWDSCVYTGEEERDFVRDFLGSAMEAHGLSHVKILVWDHNRDRLPMQVHPIYSDPECSKYVWGAAYHWYVQDKYENLQLIYDAFPDKHFLFSEGCQEVAGSNFWAAQNSVDFDAGEELLNPLESPWEYGEKYGKSMIRDFNRWNTGFIDWNLVLDETGGPNHVGFKCCAAIMADTENDTLHFQSIYYYLGHFARFVKPGAHRILCTTTRDDMEATAFINPDQSIVLVVMNETDSAKTAAVKINETQPLLELPPHSITTLVLKLS